MSFDVRGPRADDCRDPEGRICGFLDEEDKSGVEGLRNEFEWEK